MLQEEPLLSAAGMPIAREIDLGPGPVQERPDRFHLLKAA